MPRLCATLLKCCRRSLSITSGTSDLFFQDIDTLVFETGLPWWPTPVRSVLALVSRAGVQAYATKPTLNLLLLA